MSTKVTEHFFEFDTLKYFRGNAHQIELACYGEKKDPIGAKAYLSREAKVKREYVSNYVQKGKPVSINWKQASKAEVTVNGNVIVYGVNIQVGAEYSYEKLSSADLRVVPFFLTEAGMKKMLNQDAKPARDYLKREGNDGRIVSQIWIVMEAELSEIFTQSESIGVNIAGDLLKLTASGKNNRVETITLSPGSTFAYALYKVKKWDGEKIADMEDDYKGMN